jgi:hypothetical protein
MTRTLPVIFVAAVILIWGAPVQAEELNYPRHPSSANPIEPNAVQDWRSDLDYLSDKVIALHPDPFFSVSEEYFNAFRASINEQIPEMSEPEIILAFMRFLALVGGNGHDGHTGLWPYQKQADFHLYPLRLYWFEEGIYVVDSDHGLNGAKLVAINGFSVEDILSRIDPFISRDGPMWVRSWAPIHMLSPEMHQVIGIDTYDRSATLEFELDGARRSLELQSISHPEYHERFPMTLYTGTLPSAPLPRYLHRQDDYYWTEEWPDSRTVYFQYNAVTRENRSGSSLNEIVGALRLSVRSGSFDRLIVDIRSNGGGDNTAYGALLKFLQNEPFFDTPGRLFVILGRATFSAGINFATDVEKRTNAIFVGEPSGGSPNQYGDAENISLPNSQITARISTLYWAKAGEDDDRLQQEPDVSATLTALDYFQSRDAAVDAILEYQQD